MKLKFNGELSHKTSLEEERERIMIWICLLVCFSIYWDLLILFTIYNISCIYFLHFPPKKSMIQIRKNFFFLSVDHNHEKWLVEVLCMSFCFVHSLFLLLSKYTSVRSGLFFFLGINMSHVDMWKSKQYFGSEVLSRSLVQISLFSNLQEKAIL